MTASFAFQDSDVSSATASFYTLSGLTSASAAGQERFVVLGYIGQSGTRHITAVTIDGQAATLVQRGQGSSEGANPLSTTPSTEIWRAPGTVATTVDVAVTFDGTAYSLSCALYVGTGVGTVLDSDTSALDGNSAPRTDDISVDTVAGGAVLTGSLAYNGSTSATTWIGVTEDLDGVRAFAQDVFSAASASNTSVATPRDVDVTWIDVSVASNSALGATCVSFSPSEGAAYTLTAAQGALTLTGIAASLVYTPSGDVVLVAAAGAFVLTGKAAALRYAAIRTGRVVDYSALLYNPVYAALGVSAVMAAGADNISLTVIDVTRRKSLMSGSAEVTGIGPAVNVRIPELTANGIARVEDCHGAVLTFSGRSWIVRAPKKQGNANGEDLGEVLLELKAIGSSDG